MNQLDWIVITVYAAGLILLSYYLSKGQTTTTDYYLGSKRFSWWQVGLSTMATQLGAVSFISAPAFIGLRQGGGLQWLTYELAVPLAMIFLIIFLFPPLYREGVISIYSFLRNRFGQSTTQLLSGVFQFSRAFAAGITVYAVALVLESVFGIQLWISILLTGVVTLVYDYMGGMKAIIVSDIIQMGILFFGFIACSYLALDLIGSWNLFAENLDRERLEVVSFSRTGLGDGEEFGFWPMLLGGFFLYAAYYGCDQSQAQRILSSRDIGNVRNALLFNGLFRFPTVLAYSVMGLLIGTFAVMTPEFIGQIPEGNPDYMVPIFIAEYLPAGLVGLLVAAIMAAAMSSLDSALNSLSAATVEDFVIPAREKELLPGQRFRLSKRYTIFWGVICVLLAFAAESIASTVIEAINKIGSLFYGPITSTFVLAVSTRWISTKAMNIGILAGVAFNMFLWFFAEDLIFWFWWNVSGFLVTTLVAVGLSWINPRLETTGVERLPEDYRLKESSILGIYFTVIVVFSLIITFVA